MRTDLPKWPTEAHLRHEGEMRKTYLHPDEHSKIDGDTERQIAELREVRAVESDADAA